MEMPRPLYHWSLGGAKGQLGRHMVGANGVSTRVPGAKKIIFSIYLVHLLGAFGVHAMFVCLHPFSFYVAMEDCVSTITH